MCALDSVALCDYGVSDHLKVPKVHSVEIRWWSKCAGRRDVDKVEQFDVHFAICPLMPYALLDAWMVYKNIRISCVRVAALGEVTQNTRVRIDI
jgi:hypothetical protein